MSYQVKCDNCKQTIRETDNVQESYAGGTCEACRITINRQIAKVQRSRRGATK